MSEDLNFKLFPGLVTPDRLLHGTAFFVGAVMALSRFSLAGLNKKSGLANEGKTWLHSSFIRSVAMLLRYVKQIILLSACE